MKQAIYDRKKAHAALGGKRGFTLVELLISFAILTLVLTIVFQFFNFSGNMFKKTDDLAAQQDQARLIIFGLRKDLGAAMNIVALARNNNNAPSMDGYPENAVAVYVDKDGRLARKYADDSIENIYSNTPVDGLKIEFSTIESDKFVVHVTISVGNDELSSTDIYIRNLEKYFYDDTFTWETIPGPADPIPDTIVYEPAPSDAP